MFLIFLTAIIFWTAHPTFAADYEVPHLEPKRIFKGTTLFADISDREWLSWSSEFLGRFHCRNDLNYLRL